MTEEKQGETHEEVQVERMQEGSQRPYYSPLVDIYEEDEVLTLVADMPGVDTEGIELTCENGILTINGRPGPEPVPDGEVIYREYVPGDYHRCFRISDDIDVERIGAKMSNGVLTVTLPKAARVRKRHIEVK